MFSTKITGFCKSEDCPSSNDLLEFQKSDSRRYRRGSISEHLAECEFCSAEVELYSRYPQDDAIGEIIEENRIPVPLYELAEALLKKRDTDSTSLDALLKKKNNKAERLA